LKGYTELLALESAAAPCRKEGATAKAPAVRATALIASRRVIITSIVHLISTVATFEAECCRAFSSLLLRIDHWGCTRYNARLFL
jgi:hypothetical protein